MEINKINNIGFENQVKAKEINPNDPSMFSNYLKDAIKNANDLEVEAQKQAEMFLTGETDNIHEVMIAAQKAELSLQLITEVRNKLLDAYNEIMRMQI